MVGAPAGGCPVGEILGLVRGEELSDEHGPPVLPPRLPPGGDAAPRKPSPSPPGRRQRPDSRPDKRVIGRERRADWRVSCRIGDGERGFEQPPCERRIQRREAGLTCLTWRARLAGPVSRWDCRSAVGRLAVWLAAVLKQLADLRGNPAIPGHAAGVVVDDHYQRVRFLAGVAEHADDLVAVAERIRVDVAVGGCHCAHMLRPARPGDAALHQGQRCLLGPGRLARRTKAGNTGKQRERGRAALLGCVGDQALADQFLDIRLAPPRLLRAWPPGLLSPPGAEQFAHHQLGIERTAHGQQFPRGPQHLREERVRRRRGNPRS